MSRKGIKKVAHVFEIMQNQRCFLLRMATGLALNNSQLQDAELAQLLETGKEAMLDKFLEITRMRTNEDEI